MIQPIGGLEMLDRGLVWFSSDQPEVDQRLVKEKRSRKERKRSKKGPWLISVVGLVIACLVLVLVLLIIA